MNHHLSKGRVYHLHWGRQPWGPHGGTREKVPRCAALCPNTSHWSPWGSVLQVSRPHPSDHPLLILFVVGGVTVSEAKMIKDLVPSLKPGTQVRRPLRTVKERPEAQAGGGGGQGPFVRLPRASPQAPSRLPPPTPALSHSPSSCPWASCPPAGDTGRSCPLQSTPASGLQGRSCSCPQSRFLKGISSLAFSYSRVVTQGASSMQ